MDMDCGSYCSYRNISGCEVSRIEAKSLTHTHTHTHTHTRTHTHAHTHARTHTLSLSFNLDTRDTCVSLLPVPLHASVRGSGLCART